MYKTVSFKKKLLATLVASSALGLSSVAFAQDDAEEIVVTGIKASLTRALDIKRDAAGVVDAISAEDIGKMPDTNLAESLQRITGVSIDRSNGEGSTVTVRGIGSELNMVTLNGRTMPAVGNGLFNNQSTRAFDFSNIASEGVSGVEVYKTSKANVASGGLGATINFKTIKPLDLNETKATFGLKAVKDESVISGDELTPEASGLYSWSNEEKTFGVAVVGSYQKRDSGRANAFVNNWQLKTAGDPTWVDAADHSKGYATSDGTLPADNRTNADQTKWTIVDIKNAPAKGQLYNMPTDLRYAAEDNERVRKNGQLTLQFRPIETVTGTLDYTYSENAISVDRSQQSTWYDISNLRSATFDNNVVKTPVLQSYTYGGSKDIAFGQDDVTGKTANNSFGANLAWDASDDLKFGLDYHHSKAVNVYNSASAGLAVETATSEYANFGKDLPVMGWTINDNHLNGSPSYLNGNGNGITDAGDATTSIGTFDYTRQQANVEQLQLSGTYKLGDLGFLTDTALDFGIAKTKSSNNTKSGENRVTMGNWSGVAPSRFADYNFDSRDFGDLFQDYDDTTGDTHFNHQGIDADPRNLLEVVEGLNALHNDPTNFDAFINGKAKFSGELSTNRTIDEDIQSVFAQFKTKFEIAGLASNLLAGVRYEKTDLTSTSNVKIPTRLEWQSDNDWATLRENPTTTNYTKDNSYNNLLPNLDFDIALTDSIKGRISVSKTLGRPSYGDLASDVSLDPYKKTASGGNPLLKPMESKNFDLSVEWYYSDSSYVSLGYFRKDVSNFIGSGNVNQTNYDLRDVRSTGARYAAAKARIAAGNCVNCAALNSGASVTDTSNEANLHTALLELDNKNPLDLTTSVYADSTDPLLTWDTTLPVNDKSTVIDGEEFAVQHIFGESGFGFQANYTKVDADVDFDITKTTFQFAMVGLSDTANLVAFFDKYGFQARVAYNWRDKFLDSRNISANEPRYTEAFSQIDFSLGYAINDNLSVTLEGLNVTGENKRQYGRTEAQMLSLEDLFARYNLGVRYTF
jgi:TonB-dependent receptor